MKLKNELWLTVVIALVCIAALAHAQYTLVTSSTTGGTSNPAANATIYWQSVSAARIGTAGGQVLGAPQHASVTAGAFTVTLADALAANPQTCYRVTAIDNVSGQTLLGAGLAPNGIDINAGGAYGCVQPTGAVWSFDSFEPNSISTLVPVEGETITGPMTFNGPVTFGSTVNFNVISATSIAASGPVSGASGYFSTVATSPIQANFPYTLPLPNAIASTLGARATNTVYVTDFTSCAGNDAVDDSVGINNALNAVAAMGGGAVIFPDHADCRIQNEIIFPQSVGMIAEGVGAGNDGFPNNHKPRIQAAANLATPMIGQASYATFIASPYIIGLDLESGAYTVPNLVYFAAAGAFIHDVSFNSFNPSGNTRTTGDCLVMDAATDSNVGWVNWIDKNQFGYCGGWGISGNMTDSWVTNNYISNTGQGGANFYNSGGAITFVNNQVEKMTLGAGIGVEWGYNATGCEVPHPPIVEHGNRYELNNIDIYIKNGNASSANCINIGSTIGPDLFVNQTGTQTANIEIDDYINKGMILEDFSTASPTQNVLFNGSHGSGWIITGVSNNAPASRVINAPADSIIVINGQGGNLVQIPQLVAPIFTSSGGANPTSTDISTTSGATREIRLSGATSGAYNGNVQSGDFARLFDINQTAGTGGSFWGPHGSGGIRQDSAGNASFFAGVNPVDIGKCTMASGACPVQTLSHTYTVGPICLGSWTGTGTLTGLLQMPTGTDHVTPKSTSNTDTAQIEWACFGK